MTCDECGDVAEQPGYWLRLEVVDGEKTDTFRFCRLVCLYGWVEERVRRP